MGDKDEIPFELKNDIKIAFDLFKNENNKITKLKLRTLLFSFIMFKSSAGEINRYIEEKISPTQEFFNLEELNFLIESKLKEAKMKEANELIYAINGNESSEIIKELNKKKYILSSITKIKMNSQKAKILSELFKYKHFSSLQSTFWDPPEQIKKNYEIISKNLEQNSLSKNNGMSLTQSSLKDSYELLTDPKKRQNYLTFLKYYYFLSEPISLQQLKKNYHNKIFPYYIFTIKIKERIQISSLIIDFIEKKLRIVYKDKLHYEINNNDIITVNKKFGQSIILMIKGNSNNKKTNDKNKQKDEFKEIVFDPEISRQTDIIYTIISYFAKSIDDNNFYSLLENDVYRPCGIILRSKILKAHRSKILGKDDRYAVLGPSMIIIYKNEEMQDIRNVLPLFPFLMRINFIEKEKKIILKYPSREQSLIFYDNEHYSMWVTTLKEILIKRIRSKMDVVDLVEVNNIKQKDKIIKEIGVEILCAQEEVNAIKTKLEKFENKIKGNKQE